ncbi:MAG: stage III sporulation protein AE [Lachnospiraceae bacterium]|nr:stage III sporulation protein AE [Lachnospiraceae bacterium]
MGDYMRKRVICIFILICALFIFPQKIHAEETQTVVNQQLDRLRIEEIDDTADELLEDSDFSFSQTVKDIVSGGWQFSFKDCITKIVGLVFSEIFGQIKLLRRIIFIAILCGFLKTLEDSFGGKTASELGFYVCYILLIYIVMASFYENSVMVAQTTDKLILMLKEMLPAFLALMAASGRVVDSAVMAPLIMGAAMLISTLIQSMIVPAIGLTAMLEIANHISDKGLLSNLSELMKTVISVCLKGCAFAFMGVTALQKTGAAGLNGMVTKTAKVAVGAVPVVGDIMSGAVETAANFTGLLKGSVTVATVLLVAAMVMLPVIKLGVMFFIYKLAAAVIEPVSEPRLIKALNSAGDFSALLLGALFVVAVMFVFSAIILLSAG